MRKRMQHRLNEIESRTGIDFRQYAAKGLGSVATFRFNPLVRALEEIVPALKYCFVIHVAATVLVFLESGLDAGFALLLTGFTFVPVIALLWGLLSMIGKLGEDLIGMLRAILAVSDRAIIDSEKALEKNTVPTVEEVILGVCYGVAIPTMEGTVRANMGLLSRPFSWVVVPVVALVIERASKLAAKEAEKVEETAPADPQNIPDSKSPPNNPTSNKPTLEKLALYRKLHRAIEAPSQFIDRIVSRVLSIFSLILKFPVVIAAGFYFALAGIIIYLL